MNTTIVFALTTSIKIFCSFRVPSSVLKNRFSDISKAFLTLMANHSSGDAPALLKSVSD